MKKKYFLVFLLCFVAAHAFSQCYNSIQGPTKVLMTGNISSTTYYLSSNSPVPPITMLYLVELWNNNNLVATYQQAPDRSFQITWPGSGTFTLKVRIGGCTIISTPITVTQISPITPDPALTGNFMPCVGTTSSYSASAISGYTVSYQTINPKDWQAVSSSPAPYSVSWPSGPITSSISYTVIATYSSAAGSFQISKRIDLSGSTQTPQFSAVQTACASTPQTIYLSGDPAETYAWSAPGSSSLVVESHTKAANITWSNQGTYTVSATATNACTGRVVTLNKDLNVGPPPPLTPTDITSNRSIHCVEATSQFSIPEVTNATGYIWSLAKIGQGEEIINTSSPILGKTFATAGSYVLKVRGTNAYCTGQWSNAFSFEVVAKPSISFLPDQPSSLCANSTSTFAVTNLPNHQYTWTSPSNPTFDGPQNGHQVNLRFPEGFTSLTVIAENGCGIKSEPLTKSNIFVNPPPVIFGVEGSTTVCKSTYRYEVRHSPWTNSVSINLNGAGTYTSSSFYGTTIFMITWTTTGSHQVSFTANSTNCFGNTVIMPITVVEGTNKPGVQLQTPWPTSVCTNTSPTSTFQVVEEPGISYQWTLPTLDRVAAGSTNTTKILEWLTDGNKSIKVVATNGFCQSDVYSSAIVVSFPPSVGTLAASAKEICNTGTIALTLSSSSGTIEYAQRKKIDDQPWPTEWTTLSNPGSVPVTAVSNLKTQYEFKATAWSSGCGYSQPAVESVVAYNLPLTGTLSATATSICSNNPVTFNLSNSKGTIEWQAKIGSGAWNTISAASSATSLTYTPVNNGTSSVTHSIKSIARNGTCTQAETSANLTVKPIPVATITASGSTDLCIGQSVTLTSSSGSTYRWSNGLTTRSITVSVAGSYWVDVTNSSGCTTRSSAIAVSVGKKDQTITFDAISATPVHCGNGPLSLLATSTVSPIVFTSSAPDVASITSNILTIHKAGTVTITATQAGNTCYNSASASQNLTIMPGNQSIDLNTINGFSCNAEQTFTAVSSANLPVTFSSLDETALTFSGNVATAHQSGLVTFKAEQPGNTCYNGATETKEILIEAAQQTLTIETGGDHFCGDDIAFVQQSNEGLPLTFISMDPDLVTFDGNLATAHKSGTATFKVQQAGDGCFSPVESINQMSVQKRNQTILHTNIPAELQYGVTPLTLSAECESGLPVVFQSLDPTVASVTNNTLAPAGIGLADILVTQPGNECWNSVVSTVQLAVTKGIQQIVFHPIAPVPFDPYRQIYFQASSSVGLPVSFKSADESIVLVVPGTRMAFIKNAGETSITAYNPGNEFYQPAQTIQPMVVNKAIQTLFLAFNPIGNYGTDVSISANSNAGLPVTVKSENENIAVIAGNTAHLVGIGQVRLTASAPGNNNYLPASDSQMLTVFQGFQSINFSLTGNFNYSDNAPFELQGVASSGLPLTYTSSDPNIATISGNMLSIRGAGTATITASQSGDSRYFAATPVSQTLNVAKGNHSIPLGDISGCIGNQVSLPMTTTGGVTVLYSSSNPSVASVNQNVLTVLWSGTSTITASAPGNANYNPAPTVSKSLSAPFGTISQSGIDPCVNPVQLTAGTGTEYVWTHPDGKISLSFRTIKVYKPGDYKVKYKNTAGCVVSATRTLSCGGLEMLRSATDHMEQEEKIDAETEYTWGAYPNPASHSFRIYSDALKSDLEVKIVNQYGQVVRTVIIKKDERQVTLEAHDFAAGVYFIEARGKRPLRIILQSEQ